MKFFYLTLFIFISSLEVHAQYADPNFAIPSTGYGSDGSHPVGIVSFPNPLFAGSDIKIYHPSDISTNVPTLFYSHAYTANFPSHVSGLLEFVAKKGYAIVFVPYQTFGVTVVERYENLLEGFRKAARDYPAIIDTTRVGFMGHSFGGGASIGISYAAFTENNWGENGRFIHASAPWYVYNITPTQLQSFPTDTKLIVQVYDNDSVNDHRMAIDIFEHINISDAEKDFILVRADTIAGYIYKAGHDVPTTYSAFDAFDYYAYYRLIDALCDYTFNGNLAGKDVALGNGSPSQITMPAGMKNLVQTDNPDVVYPESQYVFPCTAILNLRQDYCGMLGIEDAMIEPDNLNLVPNPASDNVTIMIPANQIGQEVRIYNSIGTLVYR